MDMPKLSMPSLQSLMNFTIAILIIFAIVKFLVPEQYKSWFRV